MLYSDILFRIVKTLDPAGVERCAYRLNKLPKGKYIVPKPDYLQSIDSYNKLKQQGIEIYSGIDIYLQYIPQVYIGTSNKTTTSCLIQYLIVTKAFSRHLLIIQSNYSIETILCAEAYYALLCTTQLDVLFIEVYFYSKSISN